MAQDRKHPFDLRNQDKSLFRFHVFLLSESVFELMLSFHHAIIDGWSNINFLKDLFEYYLKFKKGAPFQSIKNSSRSYAQLIISEKKSIASKKAQKFWKQHLNTHQDHKLLSLHNGQQDVEDGVTTIYIDTDFAVGLQNQASRHQIHLKDLFLSTYLDALCEHRGVPSLTIGCVTNRRSEHLHQPLDATGLFWNILPIHMHINKDKRAQAKFVHQILTEIQPYVMYPLTQIIDDHDNSNLFFSTFNYVHFHRAKSLSNSPGLQILAFDFFNKFHFPLNLFVAFHPVQSNILVKIVYDNRYFTAIQIQDILDRFRNGLDHFISVKIHNYKTAIDTTSMSRSAVSML